MGEGEDEDGARQQLAEPRHGVGHARGESTGREQLVELDAQLVEVGVERRVQGLPAGRRDHATARPLS